MWVHVMMICAPAACASEQRRLINFGRYVGPPLSPWPHSPARRLFHLVPFSTFPPHFPIPVFLSSISFSPAPFLPPSLLPLQVLPDPAPTAPPSLPPLNEMLEAIDPSLRGVLTVEEVIQHYEAQRRQKAFEANIRRPTVPFMGMRIDEELFWSVGSVVEGDAPRGTPCVALSVALNL